MMNRMRWICLLALISLVWGCAQSPEMATVPAPPIVIPKGTAIPLILAKQLNAGEARPGEFVPLLVADDVLIDGRVAIPKGTLAEGEVTWSRSEGTLSGLMNQPARLEVKLKSLKLDKVEAPLAVDPEDPGQAFAFTRENTGKPAANEAKVDELLQDELNRQLAEKLAELFDGQNPDLTTPDSKLALDRIAGQMGLDDTKRMLDSGETNVGKLASTIQRLQKGDLSGIAKGDLTLSLGAVMELANLVGGLGDKVSRTLKGRTIRAYPGTKVEALAAEEIKL